MPAYEIADGCFPGSRRASESDYHKIKPSSSITFLFCSKVPTEIRISDFPAPLKDVQSLTIMPFSRSDSVTSFDVRGDTSISIKFASEGNTLQKASSPFLSCMRPFFTVSMDLFRCSLSFKAATPAARDSTSTENGVITFLYSAVIHPGTRA